jgi:hypothetical protein
VVQYRQAGFDASFAALSEATRRGVLVQLGRADASITDLAKKFHMTLAASRSISVSSESTGGISETFEQLDELLLTLAASRW